MSVPCMRDFYYDTSLTLLQMAQQLERQLSLAGHAQGPPGFPSYAPPPPPPQDPYRLDSGMYLVLVLLLKLG